MQAAVCSNVTLSLVNIDYNTYFGCYGSYSFGTNTAQNVPSPRYLITSTGNYCSFVFIICYLYNNKRLWAKIWNNAWKRRAVKGRYRKTQCGNDRRDAVKLKLIYFFDFYFAINETNTTLQYQLDNRGDSIINNNQYYLILITMINNNYTL